MLSSSCRSTSGLIQLVRRSSQHNVTQWHVSARSLGAASNSRGGPGFLAEMIEDLKKRGLRANGSMSVKNLFDFFQIEQKLTFSEITLKREFMRLQRLIHPDKFVNSGGDTQDKASELSMLINECFQTLRHPYKRAKYLVSITSGQSEDELDKNLDALKLDDDFLTKMMELREQVELNGDTAFLARLSAEIEDELTQLLISMNKSLKDGDTETLLEQLGKLKFLGNLHVKLADKTEGFSNY